jgi:hypothetical protein
MDLTFDSFIAYVVLSFFAFYAVIFWKMYDSVYNLNLTMTKIVLQTTDHDHKLKDHEGRLREVEKK